MKQKNRIERLRVRQVSYDTMITQMLKDDPVRAKGYHKPGSLRR